MKDSRSLINESTLPSCYFRSSVDPPYRKALIRITDLCNARCVHCFTSADKRGESIALEKLQNIILPRLKQCLVSHVTLTGGEPFVHQNIIDIVKLLTDADIKIGICTNAIEITTDQICTLSRKSNVHINVSLHGFSSESHDKFMGIKGAFTKCIYNIKQLSQYGLVQGFLVTPNIFTSIEEYEKLCEFAIESNAKYVLMNPISPMGRGEKGVEKYAVSEEVLRHIKLSTLKYSDKVQMVYIRFPNDGLPLGPCEAGNIIYMFVNGDVTICPYLVFAADTSISKYDRKEFLVGNIIQDANFSQELESYEFKDRYPLGNNNQCKQCDKNVDCGKGCPAAVICLGKNIGETDSEVCPKF